MSDRGIKSLLTSGHILTPMHYDGKIICPKYNKHDTVSNGHSMMNRKESNSCFKLKMKYYHLFSFIVQQRAGDFSRASFSPRDGATSNDNGTYMYLI